MVFSNISLHKVWVRLCGVQAVSLCVCGGGGGGGLYV